MDNEAAKPGRLQAVKGMYDMIPPQSRRLAVVERISQDVLRRYGYTEVRTPLLEYTQLFARSIGEETDIVEKEMYTFEDRDGRSVTMRPEMTASVVRAYIEHSIGQQEPITRWYGFGRMFRHERWQRARYRQFHQLDVEALGVAEPGIDAELLALLFDLADKLGLEQLELHLNTLGCPVCRPVFRQALLDYLTPHEAELCEDCRRRFRQNPLRVLDCKVEGCKRIAAGAPTPLDKACDECRTHWDGLLGELQVMELPYQIDHRLVRGLDYYTRTTFELISHAGNLGSQNTVAGGGRYDGLVEELGGPPTPAIGFAMGLERLLLALGDERPVLPPTVQVMGISQGDEPRRALLRLALKLRQAGLAVELDHRGASFKSQMKRANRLGAPLAVIVGGDELAKGAVTLRRMQSSEQEQVPMAEAVDAVKRALGAAEGAPR
jgi:histidyl-tRNA synthetase